MGPGHLAETVNVVGRYRPSVLTRTAQVATNFEQDLIASLPTTRDINATLLMAPGCVHPSGPVRELLIRAARCRPRRVYMVNGVNVNENLRGQPNNLYIEDTMAMWWCCLS